MKSEAIQGKLTEASLATPVIAEASRVCLRLIAGLTAVALVWVAFAWLVVPAVIKSAYRGESLSVFNRIISGQVVYPLEHYLASWGTMSWYVLGIMLVLGFVPIFAIATSLLQLKSPYAIKIFFATDLAIAFAYILTMIIGEPSRFLSVMINLNGEANFPTWYSSMKLFLIAVLLAVFAHHDSERTERASWPLVVAVMVFFLLSIDEVAQIHEWLGGQIDKFVLPSGSRETSVFPRTGVWMFALGPVLVGMLLSLGMSARRYFVGRERIARKYVVGMLIFVGSATGTDILLNFVSTNEMAYILQVVCEELGEMLGATILLWATWGLLVSHRFSLSIGNDEYAKGKW